MNKMTLQSMSIVFSPNMVRCADPNPMVFLELQKKVQRVIFDAATLRQQRRLIRNAQYTSEIVPFKKDRSSKDEHTTAEAVTYSTAGSKSKNGGNNGNNNNNLSAMLKNCVLL